MKLKLQAPISNPRFQEQGVRPVNSGVSLPSREISTNLKALYREEPQVSDLGRERKRGQLEPHHSEAYSNTLVRSEYVVFRV